MHELPFNPAAARNQAPILACLRPRFAAVGHVLEIGAGTGQHAVHFARALPHLIWQASDLAPCLPAMRAWIDAAGLPNLAPPRVLNAFHAVSGKPWTFAWVRFDEAPPVKPMVGANSPLRLASGAEDLGRVIAGLQAEWEGERDAALVHHWINLVHGITRRLARPWRSESRIAALWETVTRDLTSDWKLSTLAAQCSLSAEHLRRVCRRELGRTPMEHVTYMRMQRAQEILETSDEKLDAIAPRVGYHSAVVFSRAFVRVVGVTPTEYRERRRPV